MIRVFGIKNCDSVKKALKHLESKGLDFEFVDFKKTPPDEAELKRWQKFHGDWPVNKKGRTYRDLKDDFESASDKAKLKLIRENTSLVKRPVLERSNKTLCLGYDKEVFETL